ncbi:PadR family transcriptional regulator [Kamptonema cortianum]|nr:PadR family transcriptional regulator [Kamptonema cortianum]
MLTDLELTILSIVAEGARYGHELQRAIDERGLRDWLTIGEASTYYLLARLEKQDLLSSRPSAAGEQDETIFAITEAGRGVLQTAINNLLREPRSFGAGLELGLANLNVLKPAQVYHALRHRLAMLETRLAASRQAHQRLLENGDDPTDAQQALYSHSVMLMEAEYAWLEQFIANWRRRYPAVEHEDAPAPSSMDEPEMPHGAPTQIHRLTEPNHPGKKLQQINRPPQGNSPAE